MDRRLLPLTLVALALGAPSALAAATWTVARTDDAGGSCALGANCTLRQAMNSAAAGDTVSLPASATPYTLSGGLGALAANKSLIIAGSGARTTTISGSDATLVFSLGGAADPIIAISGLTISGGHNTASNAFGGGLLLNTGTFTLTEVAVVGNTATATGSNAIGGGIATGASTTLTLVRSLVGGNTATSVANAFGGGVGNGGVLNVVDSTITGNHATGPGGGFGGGISAGSGAQAKVTITGSSLVGNTASNQGGNLYANISGAGFVKFANTIIADGSGTLGANCYTVAGAFSSLGGNLESLNQCNLGAGEKHDTAAGLIALGDHGGPTDTLALAAGSAALRATSNCSTSDQRGLTRLATCSIGAFEPQAPAVSVGADPGTALVGQAITFTATASDADGDAGTPAWTFDDGAVATGASVQHAFASAGSHSATVTVTDATGLATSSPATVTVVAPQTSPPADGAGPGPGPGPAADAGAPVITKLRRAAHGALRFTLSETARVVVRLQRCTAKRCRPAGKARTHTFAAGGCTLGHLVPRHLATGRYRIVAVATDGAGNRSKTARLPFRVRT